MNNYTIFIFSTLLHENKNILSMDLEEDFDNVEISSNIISLLDDHYAIDTIDDITDSLIINNQCQFVINSDTKSLVSCTRCFDKCTQAELINNSNYDKIHSILCECGIYLKTRKIFAMHYKNSHASSHKKYHACRFCEEKCFTFHQRAAHEAKQHNFYRFTCNKCDKAFIRSDKYKNHKCVRVNPIWACNRCTLKFIHEKSLKKHLQTAHRFNLEQKIEEVEIIKNKPLEKLSECKICGEKFRHRSTKMSHMARQHNTKKPFVCTVRGCEYLTFKKDRYQAHIAKHQNPEKTFDCPICQEAFKSYNSMTHHRAKHSSESIVFQCEACGKIFTDKRNFIAHCRLHSGEGLFRCVTCNKTYNRKEHLRLHQKKLNH